MLESQYLKMYIDELSQIKPCDEAEREQLFAEVQKGNEEALNRLMEGHLRIVPEIVSSYENCGVSAGDMIQEGNMALIAGVMACKKGKPNMDFEEYLQGLVQKALQDYISDEGSETLAAKKMEDEANRLLNLTRDFEQEMGRTATLSELAERMGLPEDEVENIMRVSFSAINLGDKKEETETSNKSPLKDGWA